MLNKSFYLQQSGTVALQTGFSDSNVGYSAAATGNCQVAGMPPSFPQRQPGQPGQPQQPQSQQPANAAAGQFNAQQYQSQNQYGAQGYTQISSTTSCYPEGSSGNNTSNNAAGNKDSGYGVTDQELQAMLSHKDIASSLAEDLLKQFGGSEGLDVKEELQQPIINNGTLSSGPFSPSNLENEEKPAEVKVMNFSKT